MGNLKLVWGILLLSIVSVGISIFLFVKKPKIGYIETNILIQKYEGVKAANQQFELKTGAWKASTDSLVKKWQDDVKTFEKKRSGLSAKEIKIQEQLLYNQQEQLNKYGESVKQKTKEEQQKMLQTQFNDINDFIAEYAKSRGYDYILGANGSGNLLYADKGANITEKVLEELNKDYKKKHFK